VVLATMTEDAYLREAYRGDLRRTGGTGPTEAEAYAAVAERYPTVWAARDSTSFEGGRGNALVTVSYDGGSLVANVAGQTGAVFADAHRQALSTAGTGVQVTNTRDGLRMTVNRTYAGGPMQIELTDTEGNPVNATVSVGPEGGSSAPVGHTGEAGVVWALAPEERFTIVAIRGQSVVFLTMDPLATPTPTSQNRTQTTPSTPTPTA
jgi:hypothetical protein